VSWPRFEPSISPVRVKSVITMSTCSVLWILIYGEWGITPQGIWTGHIIFSDRGHHLILMGNVPHGSMVYPHSKHCVPKLKTLHNPFSPATISIYMPYSESKHYIKVVLTTVWISLEVPGAFHWQEQNRQPIQRKTYVTPWLQILSVFFVLIQA
jgi:hypothetical protein